MKFVIFDKNNAYCLLITKSHDILKLQHYKIMIKMKAGIKDEKGTINRAVAVFDRIGDSGLRQ